MLHHINVLRLVGKFPIINIRKVKLLLDKNDIWSEIKL